MWKGGGSKSNQVGDFLNNWVIGIDGISQGSGTGDSEKQSNFFLEGKNHQKNCLQQESEEKSRKDDTKIFCGLTKI